ncbi:MAG: TasA family protein [Actinomycetota bacterium]|jgi:spore coat-associated protein N
MSNRTTTKKLLLSLGAIGTAAAIAGLGTFATFTSTTSASQDVDSGLVQIELGADGTANRLSVDAVNIVPGDTIQRAVDLINSGDTDLSSIVLTTTADPSSLLDTDATHGLQMEIRDCSVAWTEAGSAPGYTYTCSGTESVVLASRAVIGSELALANLGSLVAGVTDHLMVKLTFPVTAGNTFQNLASTIDYEFFGTQRVATDK